MTAELKKKRKDKELLANSFALHYKKSKNKDKKEEFLTTLRKKDK